MKSERSDLDLNIAKTNAGFNINLTLTAKAKLFFAVCKMTTSGCTLPSCATITSCWPVGPRHWAAQGSHLLVSGDWVYIYWKKGSSHILSFTPPVLNTLLLRETNSKNMKCTCQNSPRSLDGTTMHFLCLPTSYTLEKPSSSTTSPHVSTSFLPI